MTTFKIPDNVLFQEVDGESVLLSQDEGCYYGLDEVGTTIGKLLDEEDLDSDGVVERLAQIYEVTRNKPMRTSTSFSRIPGNPAC